MTTSIIMLCHNINHNLYELTVNTINSIAQTKGLVEEMIIVDNGSTVGTDQILNTPTIYIRNKNNVGYPQAVNQGVDISRGNLISIINNDVRVSPNWLEVAKEIFEYNPSVGSVHYRMISYSEPIQLGYNTALTGRERWCSSSFFVIRREAFVSYDEGYGLGGYDDYDFWYRVREKGWKTAYTTKACYQHKHSSTQIALDDGKSRKERDIKNREYFKVKFGGYADDLFAKQFPDQMKENYYDFFKKL